MEPKTSRVASVGIVVENPLADVYKAGHAGAYSGYSQAYAGSVNNYLFDDLANGETFGARRSQRTKRDMQLVSTKRQAPMGTTTAPPGCGRGRRYCRSAIAAHVREDLSNRVSVITTIFIITILVIITII